MELPNPTGTDADFDRYTGGQNVPIISLQDPNPECAAARIEQWRLQIRDNSRTGARTCTSREHETTGHRN
jgi:hypothetical protein